MLEIPRFPMSIHCSRTETPVAVFPVPRFPEIHPICPSRKFDARMCGPSWRTCHCIPPLWRSKTIDAAPVSPPVRSAMWKESGMPAWSRVRSPVICQGALTPRRFASLMARSRMDFSRWSQTPDMMMETTSWKESCWKRSRRSCAWIMRSVPRNASVPPLSSGMASLLAENHVHPTLPDLRLRRAGVGLHDLISPPSIVALLEVDELHNDIVGVLPQRALLRPSEETFEVVFGTHDELRGREWAADLTDEWPAELGLLLRLRHEDADRMLAVLLLRDPLIQVERLRFVLGFRFVFHVSLQMRDDDS